LNILHHRRKDSLRTVSYEFLKTLLSTPGPSGGEGAAAIVWREEAKKFAEVRGTGWGTPSPP
jgi:putative aminopeptidase FrvX